MNDALVYGVVPFKPAPGLPGFLRYLVMTCAIVATADSNDITREFGENLARVFGTQSPFNNRSALPGLWHRLANWCNEAHAAGLPIRKVTLPPPGTGKHLGITNAIAFPSWRDLRRLRQLLDRRAEHRSIDGPADAARLLCPIVENDVSFSPAIRRASAEYQQLYLKKASLLGLHRFWMALTGLLKEHRSPPSERGLVPRLELTFGATLDDAELRCVVTDRKGNSEQLGVLEGFPDQVLAQAPEWAIAKSGNHASEALVLAIERGCIPFVEARFGVWQTALLQPPDPVRCLLLLSKQNRDVARHWGVDAEPVGENWLLTAPIPARDCRSLYQYMGLGIGTPGPTSAAIALVGGHRSGSGYLGRESLLPHIGILGPGVLTVRPAEDDGSRCELNRETASLFSMVAPTPLKGAYKFRLDEDIIPATEPLAIERSVTFFPDALEHARLGDIDETTWYSHEEAGVHSASRSPLLTDVIDEHRVIDSERSARFQDLMEAIYAGGRTGWSEQDLVLTMRAVLGEDGPSVWDVLRGLMECGWLRTTSNLRWRARRWWLTPPSLVVVRNASGVAGLLLVGSASANIRRRFQETARAAGCTVTERPGPSEYTASMQLATGRGLREMARELGWSVDERRICVPAAAPHCWSQEHVDESRHKRVAKWNWKAGGFRNPDIPQTGLVSLERFRRERGDRDDLYVVVGADPNRYVTTSRASAISEAHRRARIAMFSWDGSRLFRNSADGHLVEPLAKLAMLSACRSPGPAWLDGRWTYVYETTSDCVTLIRTVFGHGFVQQTSTLEPTASRLSAESIGWLRNRNLFRAENLTLPTAGQR
ncbi:hypothetical protein [Caballeronia sp. RCC_10]|uniref:hypothetical protein n=1 Tax=Caballeronia sp. RCC_10 TaxID=3239227 RepID=UPI003523438D